MKIDRLVGLRVADLTALEGELGGGLVALVASPEDAGEARRALVWAGVVGDGGVAVSGPREGLGVEALWGGLGGLPEALDAAVKWVAGAPLVRVEAARGALTEGRSSDPELAGDDAEATPSADLRVALGDALEELRARERELRDLRAEWAEVTGDVEQATMDWLRERQDAETQLQAYRDRARELKARLAQLLAGGPDAPCPTCGRPLADHLKDVRVQLREEWESVVQDGSWWKRRREQLEDKPEHLRALEGRGVRVSAAVESGAERVERVRARVRDLKTASVRRPAAAGESPEVRALDRLADELRVDALDRVLREAGRMAERITAGRILWIRPSLGGPAAEGLFSGGVPGARDRAAAELACRVAAATLAREAGAPLGGMVVGEAFEALDGEDRLRAVDVLGESARSLGQVVIVTGTDIVDLRPEAFERAFELRAGRRSSRTAPLVPLRTGTARIRVQPAGATID